jgi:hypothetical protein
VGVTATPITVGRSHVAPKSVRCQSESFPPSDNANSPGCWGGLPCAYYYPSRYGSAVSKPVLDAREIASPRVALGLPRARAWTAWEWCAAVAKSAIQCRPRRSDEWSRNLPTFYELVFGTQRWTALICVRRPSVRLAPYPPIEAGCLGGWEMITHFEQSLHRVRIGNQSCYESGMARKLTDKMIKTLAVMPDDGSLIDQDEISLRSGHAVGTILTALEKRGLVKEDREPGNPTGRTWLWRKIMNS